MNRRTWWWLGCALAAMALVTVVTARMSREQERSFRASTFNAGPEGLRAIFETLDATGTPVRRWQRPYAQLPDEARVLIVAAPLRAVTLAEWEDHIRPWLAQGRTVILASRLGEILPTGGPSEWVLSRELRYGHSPFSPRQDGQTDDDAEDEDAEDSLAERLRRAEGPPVPITPVQPLPLTPVDRRLMVEPFDPVHVYAPDAAPLYVGTNGPFAWHLPVHDGRIILTATSSWLSNKRIADAHNLDFLLRIFALYGDGGAVLFDERAQGYPVGDIRLRDLLGQSAWTAALWQLLFLGVWYSASNGRRFGRPIPVIRETYRSTLEYVDAMANLYRRARLHRPTLAAHWQGFRVDVAKRYGIEPRAPVRDLRDRLLAAVPHLEAAAIDRALVEVRQALRAERSLSERQLVRAARTIDDLRRKVL